MRPQLLVRLPIAIRRVWHDRFQGRETITIRIVRPSPLADPDGSRKFHIIAELNRPVVTPLQPMLVALRQITSQGVGAPVWCVSLFPARFTSDDIRNECAQHCERHHLLIPLGGPLRRWMSPYNERQSTPGLFLPCWYDLRLQPVVAAYEVDEEAVHLMQRAVSRSPRRTGTGYTIKYRQWWYHGFGSRLSHGLGTPAHCAGQVHDADICSTNPGYLEMSSTCPSYWLALGPIPPAGFGSLSAPHVHHRALHWP